jgi:hypothetical protein
MDTGSNGLNQRPSQQPVTSAVHQTAVAQGVRKRRPHRKFYLAGTVLVLLVAIGVFWSWWLFGRAPAFNEDANINNNEFQAIFLTNGQVYFGKLADLNHKYVTITDVYYLQVQQNTSLQGASSSTTPDSQVSLVKLGSELHGPEDKMYIANDQMLFWENLKSGSKVVQAINRYQDQQ